MFFTPIGVGTASSPHRAALEKLWGMWPSPRLCERSGFFVILREIHIQRQARVLQRAISARHGVEELFEVPGAGLGQGKEQCFGQQKWVPSMTTVFRLARLVGILSRKIQQS